MEGLKHFSHKHPIILSKYNNSPADAVCRGCHDPIIVNTYVYHCTQRSYTTEDSPCNQYFLHKACANLTPIIQHHLHIEHTLTLINKRESPIAGHNFVALFVSYCKFCDHSLVQPQFVYQCTICHFDVCLKCASLERELNHPSHNHTLSLLPLKAILHICGACGTEGSKDFSYLCQTCFFWIHKTCASAPAKLICKDHHNDHPLVLGYYLPEEYQTFGVSCTLCPEVVYPFYWLYYCAGCRYFAHVKCALSAAESGEDRNKNVDEGDYDDSDLVHLPRSENEPYMLYQLIQQFAKNCSTSTDERSGKADIISHCGNGHSLILFDEFNNKNVVEIKANEEMICDGCVQPLLISPPDSFYGCLACNFFLHSVCAVELPKEFQHTLHPEHKLIRCSQTSKPLDFFTCKLCNIECSGMFYRCDSCGFCVDIVCAAMPSKIKHDSHKHTLHQLSDISKNCDGCVYKKFSSFFGCMICDYHIHIGCARKPGTIRHRWDEHQLLLMYPPVKGHPHDFNCELCSEDINPNRWFYHCHKCDTSFHVHCLYQDDFSNIKLGVIVKDDDLHRHNLEITRTRQELKCGKCGDYDNSGWPSLKCVLCKFSVCCICTL